MLNKMKFFAGELKHSAIFIVVITFQVAISILLLNFTLTKAYNESIDTKYYSKNVEQNSYVMFNQGKYTGSTQAKEISKLTGTDLKELATTAEIGNIEERYIDEKGEERTKYFFSIGLATPALMNNFYTFNTKIKRGKVDGYYEAMVSGADTKYKIGEIYDIVFKTAEDELKEIKIKVIGMSEFTDYFYNFEQASDFGSFIYSYLPFKILICDDIAAYDFAELNAGIFVTDKPVSFYQNLGFSAKSVKDLYLNYKEKNKEDSQIFSYMAEILTLFAFVCTFCLYLIDVYNSDKRRAVNFTCGVTNKSQLIIEILKMATIFILAIIPNIIVATIFGTKEMYNTMDGNLLTVPYAFAATGIMLGIYSLAILVGMVKYIKTKPIQIINNVH